MKEEYIFMNIWINIMKMSKSIQKVFGVILVCMFTVLILSSQDNPEWIQKDGKWYKYSTVGPGITTDAQIEAQSFGAIGSSISLIDNLMKMMTKEDYSAVHEAKGKIKLSKASKKLGQAAYWLNKEYQKGNITLIQFLVIQKTLLPDLTDEDIKVMALEVNTIK